jgi:hypothetical protein
MQKKLLVFLVFMLGAFGALMIAVSLPRSLIFAPIKIILIIIAGVLDVMAVASRYYTYMIMPLIQQRKRDVVLSDEIPYHLSTNGDAIIRKEGEEYFATAYVSIPLYRSASEMSPDEKISFDSQIARLTTIIKTPVRFTTEMYVMNKDSYISTLRDTVDKKEGEEAKLMQDVNADPKMLNRTRGELTMWRNMLESVSSSPSFEIVTYAAVAAHGYKEYEAAAAVQQRASEIMAGIGSQLGVMPGIVTGEDLLKFVEPEYLIPYSTVSEQINENLVKEGGY